MKKRLAFICVHNSCRSQIAEAFAKAYGKDKVDVYSGGTELVEKINQDAVRLMKEHYGIDMESSQRPKLIGEIPEVDSIITMGCNVVCPVLPYEVDIEDWGLEDPTGKPVKEFLETIFTIEKKVKELLETLES